MGSNYTQFCWYICLFFVPCTFLAIKDPSSSLGSKRLTIILSLIKATLLKMASFQRVRFIFQISKPPKKDVPNHYPELDIWISFLLLWAGISSSKFRIMIWNIFLRFGDLKNKLHSLKKATFMSNLLNGRNTKKLKNQKTGLFSQIVSKKANIII